MEASQSLQFATTEGRVQQLAASAPTGHTSYLEALTRGRCPSISEATTEHAPPPEEERGAAPRPALPSVGGAFRDRVRSVSFSAAASAASPPAGSPPRWREHASEAGSPTLEQVLLMSRQSPGPDAGYGSLGLGQASDPAPSPPSPASASPSPTSLPSAMARLTMADVVGIDVAVAQAAQTLQQLQQQQAALYGGMGGLYYPAQYYGHTYPPEQQGVSPMLGTILASVQQPPPRHEPRDPLALERAARLYRSAASVCEASCTWSGQLPPRSSTAGPNSSYSTKIFLGGVPWDISEQTLVQAFADFGEVRVEWPGRDYTGPPRGYLYLVFQEERDVIDLLSKCGQDYSSRDSYYYKISSRRMRAKEVQIIPWVISDSNFVKCASPRLDPQKTVFVGALHGMMTAQGLALIFQDLFGGVVYAGLDTDKYKYPIGSGRVTFNNSRAYMKAVAAAFIEIKTPRFCKKVQVDPYLEDTLCSLCSMKQGPYFCRDLACFNYFCHGCWEHQHAGRTQHKPLMRNIRGLTRARAGHGNLPPDLGGAGRHRAEALQELALQFGQTFGPPQGPA